MDQYEVISELLRRYNTGEISLDDQQAEMLAMQAHKLGLDFDVESKPIQKGLFDAADMALFGMLPNEWRPTSPGQELYGESGWDRGAGLLGSVAGLGTGIFGAVKGASKLKGMYQESGGIKAAVAKAKETEAAARAAGLAQSVYNKGSNVVGGVSRGVGRGVGAIDRRFPAFRDARRIVPEDIGIGGRRGFEGMFQRGGMVGMQEGGLSDEKFYEFKTAGSLDGSGKHSDRYNRVHDLRMALPSDAKPYKYEGPGTGDINRLVDVDERDKIREMEAIGKRNIERDMRARAKNINLGNLWDEGLSNASAIAKKEAERKALIQSHIDRQAAKEAHQAGQGHRAREVRAGLLADPFGYQVGGFSPNRFLSGQARVIPPMRSVDREEENGGGAVKSLMKLASIAGGF
tara:strand:+ start:2405 stop:3613 length:1209 start_codon:yes stop_codon:yes gene_type:complete